MMRPLSADKPSHWNSPSSVRETLAQFGLGSVNRLNPRGVDSRHTDADVARRLRAALDVLGPVFRCFARHVATRPDLVDAPFWTALGELQDDFEPAEPSQLLSWLEDELGAPPSAIFDAVEHRPFSSSLAFQLHRGRLKDAREVTIKVARRGARELLLASLPDLRALQPPLGLREIDRDLDDFVQIFTEGMDFSNELAALESMAEDASRCEALSASIPLSELCTAGLLVVETPFGATLADVLTHFNSASEDSVYIHGIRISRVDGARRLCRAWLHQALMGHAFAIDPADAQIIFVPGRSVAIGGDRLTALDGLRQAHLYAYLLAVANDDPAAAGRHLAKDLIPGASNDRDAELERRFRQLVPFRDGGWNSGGAQLMTHEVFCQWRTAARMGYVPSRQLAAFYSGFARTALWAHQLAPEADCMREALRELRLAAGAAQMFDTLTPDYAGEWLRQFAELVIRTPKGMNEFLRLGLPAANEAPRAADGKTRGSITAVAGLLAIFAALSLLLRTWMPDPGSGVEITAVAGMAVAGVLLLVAVARM